MGAIVGIDIETVPLLSSMSLPYPEETRNPPSNYKKAESIAEWREKDKKEWDADRIKQYSLSPLYGRVVAVGLASEEHSTNNIAPSEKDEVRLLEDLWDEVSRFDTVLTWNGYGFDIPFLLTRSAILGVPTPRGLLKRYDTSTHCDVKMLLTNWASASRPLNSLDDWCNAFGIGGKIAHGSEVFGMYTRGDFDAIGEYAQDDAVKVVQLYNKAGFAFL